ncbi:crossover junction endodeoxyribonuclease RuvC [bacterium]|nr:crossover junction endodeoxyribonuclease RuvC [bacterium]MCG2677712.1 crossover junction endodeoxyribonuclease RuvC [bacterium]
MIILGIDPGTAATGYGIIETKKGKHKALGYGCIKTTPKTPFPQRLKIIYQELGKIIREYSPDVVAMEQLFFARNAMTAISVGQAQGMLFLAAADADLEVVRYPPLQIKMTITGKGRAEKSKVQKKIKRLLRLKKIPRPVDASDALAVALCHILLSKSKKVKR